MNEQQPQTVRPRERRSATGIIAGLAVLVAFVALGISVYGLLKQPATMVVEVQLPYVIAGGFSLTIATVIAFFRNMGVWDILEAMWDAVAMLFGLIGAMLKGIWDAILGLFGWN